MSSQVKDEPMVVMAVTYVQSPELKEVVMLVRVPFSLASYCCVSESVIGTIIAIMLQRPFIDTCIPLEDFLEMLVVDVSDNTFPIIMSNNKDAFVATMRDTEVCRELIATVEMKSNLTACITLPILPGLSKVSYIGKDLAEQYARAEKPLLKIYRSIMMNKITAVKVCKISRTRVSLLLKCANVGSKKRTQLRQTLLDTALQIKPAVVEKTTLEKMFPSLELGSYVKVVKEETFAKILCACPATGSHDSSLCAKLLVDGICEQARKTNNISSRIKFDYKTFTVSLRNLNATLEYLDMDWDWLKDAESDMAKEKVKKGRFLSGLKKKVTQKIKKAAECKADERKRVYEKKEIEKQEKEARRERENERKQAKKQKELEESKRRKATENKRKQQKYIDEKKRKQQKEIDEKKRKQQKEIDEKKRKQQKEIDEKKRKQQKEIDDDNRKQQKEIEMIADKAKKEDRKKLKKKEVSKQHDRYKAYLRIDGKKKTRPKKLVHDLPCNMGNFPDPALYFSRYAPCGVIAAIQNESMKHMDILSRHYVSDSNVLVVAFSFRTLLEHQKDSLVKEIMYKNKLCDFWYNRCNRCKGMFDVAYKSKVCECTKCCHKYIDHVYRATRYVGSSTVLKFECHY